MKRALGTTALLLCAALTLMTAPAVFADDHESGFHNDLAANLEATGKKLIQLAEATPDHMFTWRPTVEVRSISEVYVHTIGVNLILPSALGAAPPEGVNPGPNAFAMMQQWEKDITTKEEVVKKLKESFEHVVKAVHEIQDLDTEVTLFGPPQTKRAFLYIILGHAHEHLGQSIAYARSIGVAPPWSGGGSDDNDG